jgi:hypothetical protein
MSLFEPKDGVFLVRYSSPEALSPERQQDLEAALRASSSERPLGIVFLVDPAVKTVDPAVPAYWLGITGDPTIRIAAMAIVTPNPAVSVATRGFSTANILKDRPLSVKPFADEAAALAWVKGVLAGTGAAKA